MAKKKTYYDPQNGQHYYHGEDIGAANWSAPESVKDESYINQYNYTPSYNAYRQYLEEEERRRKRLAEQNVLSPTIQVEDGQKPGQFDPQAARAKAEPRVRFEQELNNIAQSDPSYKNMSAEDKYNMFAKEINDQLAAAGRSQGMNNWAKGLKGDPEFDRMSEEEKKRQYMMSLEQKAKDNGTLPEDQKLELIDYKYNRLTDRERGAIDMLMGAEGSAFDRQNMGAKEALDHIINGKTLREKFNWSADANETNNRNKLEAINELKHLGWDEERIKKDVAGFKELEDYRKTQERNQDLAINPNVSWQEKTLKGISNSLEDIASAPARGLLSWAGRKVEGEGAYGTNTYSKYDYMRNRDEEAVNQVRENAIGSDHPNWQTAYDIGISGAESLYTMLLTNAVAGGLGVAGAGKALTTAKKTGEAITTGMKAAAAAEKAVELGTLIPFSANAYDSAYKDAVERGFSEKQAQGFGAAVGGIEALTELFSLDKYWEMAEGTKVGRNLFVRALAQAGIEGSEEVASELGQRFADYVATEVGGTGKTQKELDIEEFMAQGMSREEATEAASEKFVQQIGMAALSGAGAATMSTPIMMGVGRARAKSAGKLNDAISNRYQSLEVKGDSEYEQMLKADKERYQNNPTQFIVDQYKAYDEETERIKKGLQEIADKEKEGKKLSTSDRAFIAENAQVGDEFFKKLYDISDQSNIPYEFRDVKYDITEDEARTMLGKAANEGDTEGFIKAMQMTRNSSDENVAKNAEEIISLYSGRAEMNGITKEAIGQAMLSKKRAYIAGLNNENLGEMSAENQIAYNEGKKAYIENKTRTTTNQAAIQNAVMGTHDGGTVKLAGRFDENGVVTQDGKSVKMDELDMTSDSAITKAYQYADNYKNVNVKNEFMQGITEDTNIREYARDFKKEYDLGMSGVSEETAKQGISTLTDEQRKIAYEAGQRDARIRATNEINKGWGVVHKAEGVFYDEANVGDKKLTEMFDRIAAKLGVDIHIVDNMNNPKARGSFDKNSNTIYVNASKAIAVFHEIGEFSEVYNKEGYDDLKKAVADLSAKKFGADNFARMIRDYQTAYGRVEGQDTQADEMSGEMFNDVISAMLSTDKGAQAFANYLADNYDAQQAKTLGQQAAGIVKKLANAIKKLASPEKGNLSGEYQEAVYQIADELSEHADKFISMLDKAVQNYQKAAGIEMEQKLDKVSVNNGNEKQFSIETYKTDGRDILQEYLEDYSGLSKKDQKAIIETLDWGYEVAKEMASDNKFRSFGKWSKTGLVAAPDGTPMIRVMGNNGKPIQSVAVSNGEYPLNIDFTQVCKKRLALNSVLNRLVSDTKYDIRMLSESDIAGINALIKEHQFEIACGLCFVDARRYRVGSWAESFVNGKTDEKTGEHSYGWNELVNSMLKRGVQASYFHLASDHVDPLGANLAQIDDKDIDFKIINKIIKPYLKEDGTIGQTIINGKKANPTEEVRMAYLLKSDPSTRHLLDKNDIIASEGLDALRVSDPKVYALVNSHGGTSKPKLSHGFTAYGNEVIRSQGWGANNDFSKENAYAVGGVRVQSFSDYVANMFFDYMQMFADMSARELPSHAYTKEPNYVKLFGMTGQRINMSLIFKGANLTDEQQARLEKLSKKGRKAVEKDPEFGEMIKHAGLDEKGNYLYEDESFPHEEAYKIRKDARYKNVGTIAVGLSDEHIKKLLNDPQIDMVIPYPSSGVSQIIKNARNLVLYTDYTDSQNTRKANGKKLETGDYDWYANLKSEINPKGMTLEETVKDYLKWCDKNNYLPVFDQFRNEPGYWKLLIDFRSYDNNGKFMPQGKVTMTFPDNFKDIVKESLKEQQKFEDRLEAEMKDEQDALYSDVKNFLKEKGSVVETRFSLTVDSEGNNLTEGQQEYFKDSKIVDEQGRLKVMYHGSPNKFTIFDPKKLGGKNGTAEGFGIYFADTQEVTKAYGDEQLKGYLNVTHPASSFEKTITANDLSKLIKATAIKEAEQLVADGEYDAVDEAIKDSWVSNYENTYEMSMDAVYKQVANDILKLNGNDMDIIQEVMAGLGIRDYAQAYDFYETLTDTLGIDGYVTNWTGSNGETSGIVVVFNSNQFKNIDNENPTENEDIRYSIEVDDNGHNFVNIQDDIISNLTDDDQIKDYVRTYLLEYFPRIDMNGFELPLNSDSRSEYTDSRYSQRIQAQAHNLFMDKMRMAANLDEIVNTADGYKYEKPKHKRKDDKIGFVRGNIPVRVGSNDYIADVVLADRKNAGLMFYDIINLVPTKIKTAAKPISPQKQSSQTAAVSKQSVSQNAQNIKHSLTIESLIDNIDDLLTIEDLEEDLGIFTEEVQEVADAKPKQKKERARHLLRSMLGSEFEVVDGKKIAFTDERIEKLLKMYAASNKDYGQAYLTYMSPADYLLLTTNGNDGTRSLDRIKEQSTPLDVEELKNVYDTQPIFLDLAEKGVGKATKNEIIGHEGRHRMYALQLAGFNQIPVLVFNYDNKYSKKAIDSISVYPQAFDEDVKYGKSNMITLTNLQPLTRGNEDNIKQMFGPGQEDADLRFSFDVDSNGNNLTEDQQEFFKDSVVRDRNGALKVMYHGAKNANYTVFNPSFSDDGISLFFADTEFTASGYADTRFEAEPDNLKGEAGIYHVYLNITNPLVVDANGAQWDDIEWYPEEYERMQELRDELKELDEKQHLGLRLTDRELDRSDDAWSELQDLEYEIETMYGDLSTTRGIAAYAHDKGYDGVIINDVVDEGEFSRYDQDSQIVIAFNSNQVKSIHNKKPTSDKDIRYSIDVDSEGRTLTEGQQKYFNNTKVVDDEGRLKVMYHGTEQGGFTVFDPEYSDDRISLFFTDNQDVAASYMRSVGHKFDANEQMSDEEITTSEQAVKYLESIGYSNFKYGGASQYWMFTDPNGEDKRIMQQYLVPMAESRRTSTNVLYPVYLNAENSMVIDANNNQWNRLTGQWLTDKESGNIVTDLTFERIDDDTYGVWSNELEYERGIMSLNEIEYKFGEDIADAVKDNDAIKLTSVVYNPETRTVVPNDTRSAAQMAKARGFDSVIIKNVKDNGGAFTGFDKEKSKKASKPSTVVIIFNPEQVKDINNLNPTSSEDIRYALDLDEGDSWVDFDAYLGSDMSTKATEEQAVNILEKGMEALKNKEVDVPKLRNLALKLRNEYGSGYNVNELTDRLQKAFAYMQTEDHVDYKTMMGILRDIAKPVIESSGDKVGEQEYKDFIANFKGRKIKLTAKQKEEVKYALGSYGKFRNAIMPITISDNGDTTLDQIWDELVEQSGYMLDRDAVEGEMPLNLLDTLQAMRPTVRNDFGGDIDDMAKDLAMRIVEEYVEGETAKQMGQEIKEYRARLKKDYQERMKDLKGQVNAEARARNKRRAEQAKEREDVRRLKHDIKQQAAKLFKWIEKPTEGKSVPHNMVVPVMQFLQAIDFVDPVITMGEDGKWHTKVFDRVDYEDGHKKFIYKDLVGDSYEDVLKQFNEAIGRGEGSKEQRTWADKMQGMREIYDKVLKDSDFEDNSMDFLMQTLDAQGLAEDFDKLLSDHKGELSMNHLNSRELTLIDNITKNIFHAVNQGNKAFSSNVDIINLAQSTIQDSEGKELKNRNGILKGVYKMLRLDNVTPRTFFKLLGSRGAEVYKFLRGGLNQEILDLKKASEFMEGAMKGIDARKWTGEGATIHDIALSNGSVKMTDAQILGLYFTIRRNGGMDRIKGGIEVDDIKTRKERIKKQNAIHLTESDIQKIVSVLTPEQIELGKKMQKYMADDCSAQGNDTSMRLYGFKKFTDSTYYPWTVDKDTVPTNNTSENVPMFTGIERSGFTRQLKEGATNPLVIRDIFDVFSDHVSQMAAYHGYAASVKDTLRWMNYREKSSGDGFDNWITNKKAINKLSGDEGGVGYITKLLLDINQANKSQYIGNFTDRLIGNYKAAAVGANLRVIAQQPTAYFRALNQIDAKYLFTVNPATAIKNIKKSQDQSPISWWKSKGYYETNLGQPIKEIVTGIATPAEKAKDIMMSPAGWADDFTWGFLYTAVENEQRAKLRGQNVSAEEFRKAVNDRFDEVVDNTQVVDSTLHRSQIMRSKDSLNKLQTAFMAEPTKSYNMLLEAGVEDMREKTGKRTARAVMAFLLSTLATSAAAAVVDAMRKNNDDEKWWETWLNNLKENVADNMNPFNLLPVVKDVSAAIYNQMTGQSTFGQSGNRFDIEAISSVQNAVNTWKKLMEGESNKTGYGVALATLKPISQITGIPVYNLTKDAVALYNTFFENIQTTVSSNSTAKNERKKELVSDLKRGRSDETLDEAITDAIEHGVSIYDLKGAVQSEYKNKYFDAFTEGDEEEARDISNTAARAYARMGLTDEEIDEIINEWQEEVVTYSALDKAIASGEGIVEEAQRVMEAKDPDKIIKHIMDRYTQTVAYEDTHDTESEWRKNVETALQTVDGTLDFDKAHEEALEKKKEQEEKAAATAKNQAMKGDFFDAVDRKDGSAGRKALETMKNEGIEAKTVKQATSTKYHEIWKEAKSQAEKDKAKSDWKSAYTLINTVYGSKSNDLDKTWNDWEAEQKK